MSPKILRFGLIDAKLAIPIFVNFDLNNIMPTIRQARIDYIESFMAAGSFRRQPVINIIFELPNDRWRYVHSWIRLADENPKILELTRDVINEPDKLIFEILRTWRDCEKKWIQHIEEVVAEFEKTLLSDFGNYHQVLELRKR
jgi:hypothetical protein